MKNAKIRCDLLINAVPVDNARLAREVASGLSTANQLTVAQAMMQIKIGQSKRDKIVKLVVGHNLWLMCQIGMLKFKMETTLTLTQLFLRRTFTTDRLVL